MDNVTVSPSSQDYLRPDASPGHSPAGRPLSQSPCGRFTVISGDRWRDEAWLSDAETGLICHVCHGKGADLAPEPPRRAASVDDDDQP